MIPSENQTVASNASTAPCTPFYRTYQRPIYEVSSAIRSLCTQGEVALLYGLGNIMEANAFLLLTFASQYKVNPVICEHIISATLGYGKPYEELEYERLAKGKESLWQVGTGRSPRQVRRDVDAMCEAGVVHKIFRLGESNLFSINLDKLLEFIREQLRAHGGDNSNKSRYLRKLWAEQVEPHLAHFAGLTRKVQEFAKAVGRKSHEIIADLRNRATQLSAIAEENCVKVVEKIKEAVVFTLDVMVGGAKQRIADSKEAKRDRRCGEPLFDLKGGGNGLAGLALWEKLGKDYYAEHFYVSMTGKAIGQMKKYLEELRSQGRSEEQVREYIKALISVWKRPLIPLTFEMPGKFGPRKFPIPAAPDFETFFPARTQITRTLFDHTAPHLYNTEDKQGPGGRWGAF